METIKIYLSNRKLQLDVRVVEKRKHTTVVKLPDGNIIVRKNRDIVKD